MTFHVNDSCIGCGLCAEICPEVFQMTDAGVSQAVEEAVSPAVEDSAREAQTSCPVSAIETL